MNREPAGIEIETAYLHKLLNNYDYITTSNDSKRRRKFASLNRDKGTYFKDLQQKLFCLIIVVERAIICDAYTNKLWVIPLINVR